MPMIDGTGNADTLQGTASDDQISGFGGDDVIYGGGGDDEMFGHAGHDFILGGAGDDLLEGGDGNDYLQANYGEDVIKGGLGDDEITDHGGDGTAFGGDGADGIQVSVSRSLSTYLVDGGTGDDHLRVTVYDGGAVTAKGGAGADTIEIVQMDGTIDISLGAGRDIVRFGNPFIDEFGEPSLQPSSIAIGDFVAGAAGDLVDWDYFLGTSLTDWDQSANPFSTGHLRLIQSGADTLVEIDLDGGGDGYFTLIALRNIAATALSAENFDFYDPDGSQVAGQIIYGTPDLDHLLGGLGDDVIHSGGGPGSINGSGGSDRLFGGDGAETLVGEVGHDFLDGGAERDTLKGGTGNDELRGSDGDDRLYGEEGDDLLDGGAGDDSLDAGSGFDRLIGGVGNDRLFGGRGSGKLEGGDGDDEVRISLRVDEPTIIVSGGAGNDLIAIWAIHQGNLRVDAGSGADRIEFHGGLGSWIVTAGGGADTVAFFGPYSEFYTSGIAVTDFIVGPAGESIDWGDLLSSNLVGWDGAADPFRAGYLRLTQSGSSTLLQMDRDPGSSQLLTLATFNNALASDFTTENLGGYSPIPVRNGTSASDSMVGNGAAERLNGLAGHDDLRGNGGNDLLVGGTGNDVLVGGTGRDRHDGGAGDDIYEIDHGGDRIFEYEAEGIDLVRSLVSFTLPANVEKLVLTGTEAIGGTGNALPNAITGNVASNLLAGGDGGDTLNGAGGADEMRGGAGDDIYIVDLSADRIVEGSGKGADTVRSSASYILPDHVEQLVLTGGGDTNATGNGLVNSLTGNGGNNRLDGGAGADMLAGGAGHDVYRVDNAGDRVVESGSSGSDTVESSVSYALPIHVEKLILTGSLGYDGRGNAGDNTISGNPGRNFLNGGRGDDLIDGAGGNDQLMGNLGNDRLKGGAGDDRFYFNVAPGGADADRILDFSAADDSLYLHRSLFAGTGPNGTLAASAFHQGSAAADAGDRILYDAATGSIFYDSDGTGAAAPLLFATVGAGTSLTHADFNIYG